MFVVMSDSHSDRGIVEDIKNRYWTKASAIFHCGDSELPSSDPIWHGLTVVAGNCDYDEGYKNYQLCKVEGKKILITHGHLYGVGLGLDRLSYFAEQEEADVTLFGHIHRPVVELIGRRLFINPGSVSKPRGEWNIKMYALVEVFTDKAHTRYKISYRDRKHRKIPKLQFVKEFVND